MSVLPGAAITLFMAILAAVAGVIRGFSGFGAGLVMVPALGLLLGPSLAVPVVVLLEAIIIMQLVPPALRLVRWRSILPIGASAALTIPVGSLILAGMDPAHLQKGISAVVLIFTGVLATGWRYRREPSSWAASIVGGASGLLTGSAGIGGPPVILFLLSGPHRAPESRAGFLCYFAITQIVALTAFGANGLMTWRVVITALALTPFFMTGAWAGTRLFGRVEERSFRRAVLIFLALSALAGILLQRPGG